MSAQGRTPVRLRWATVAAVLIVANVASGQFTFGGQLLQRPEYRHGYGRLIPEGAEPAAFVAQRLRLQGTYRFENVTLFASIQDVRTWGNTAQLTITDSLLSMHEAWVELRLDTSWSVRLGRQELVYDNSRFLGNVDWAMQARAHDFALVKYERGNTKVHFGGGYNQDAETLTSVVPRTAPQYRTAQLVHGETKAGRVELAVLFWNDGRQYAVRDSAQVIIAKGVRHAQTFGISKLSSKWGRTTLSGFAYYQTGMDAKGRQLNAYDASVQVSRLVRERVDGRNQLRLTFGGELISGTANNATDGGNRSFSPLYGTNHMHNGYMDLFFVGGRHEGSTGLLDVFLRGKWEFTPTTFVSLNTHVFSTQAGIYRSGMRQNDLLGTELDANAGFLVSRSVSVQCGYSQLFATGTLELIQAVAAPQRVQNWGYLMLIVRPGSDKRTIGLLF